MVKPTQEIHESCVVVVDVCEKVEVTFVEKLDTTSLRHRPLCVIFMKRPGRCRRLACC